MIIVNLNGGLGNQMFQYAVGRALSSRLNAELKLDISNLGVRSSLGHTLRQYELDCFNINASIASAKEIAMFTRRQPTLIERAAKKIFKIPFRSTSSHIFEKSFYFDPEVLNLPDNVYVQGFWQSWKYFAEIEYLIRSDFTTHHRLNSIGLEFKNLISSHNSVSIHIRRGDYVNDPVTNKYHGMCSLSYYYKCIENLKKQVKDPHFFVFSDEPQWAYENLKTQDTVHIVDCNAKDHPCLDMYLMSICKHNIIANSSFSWWAAWLNANPEKLVFAPANWFGNSTNRTDDLILPNWKLV